MRDRKAELKLLRLGLTAAMEMNRTAKPPARPEQVAKPIARAIRRIGWGSI